MTTPKREVETLLDELLPFAKEMLAEHGEFHPFGGFIRLDGAIVHVGATSSLTVGSRAATLFDLLVQDFRTRARNGEIKASAIVFNVRIKPPTGPEKTDAIQVNLEHRSSYSAEVIFPYSIDEDGSVAFGDTFAQRGEHTVFPGS